VAWRSFGSRLAVAAGALVALLSLLFDAPLSLASLRGAATVIVLRVTVALGARALVRVASWSAEPERLMDTNEQPPGPDVASPPPVRT
jgi:hypothetical protein